MPIISTKGNYAIGALFELAKNYPDNLLQIKQINALTNIPKNYLEQILYQLKNSGFVHSVRGANGGYKLSKSPKEILISDVLVALEGNFHKVSVSSENTILEQFWNGSSNEVLSIFNQPLNILIEKWQQEVNNYTI
jgi:Rrf2 family transcriptional regulator, cysteine metabolism repressor